MADLVVHPRETIAFDTFDASPGPAVALDGFVAGPTRFTSGHANFNHHEDVDRFATRATCEQVALAVRMRLPLLADPQLSVHVNDPDPDVCFAVWLLEHPALVDHPAIERLCTLEGAVDASGGTCLPGSPDDVDTLAWVVDPWAAWRTEGAPDGEMAAVIRAVGGRLDAVAEGRPGRVDLTDSYEVVAATGDVWALVERHPLARARAAADGVRVYLAVRPGPTPDTRTVSLGRVSPFVPADLPGCYAALNAAEPDGHLAGDPLDCWGGSDLVGGSPRRSGTALPVAELVGIVADLTTRPPSLPSV
jgi:hypothetical protein